jgi:hypothetical protein
MRLYATTLLLGVLGCTTVVINTMEAKLVLPESAVPASGISSVDVTIEPVAGFESLWASEGDKVGGATTTDGFTATWQIANANDAGGREFTLHLDVNPFGTGSTWSLFLNRNPDGTEFEIRAAANAGSAVLFAGSQTTDTSGRAITFRREGAVVTVNLTCVSDAGCTSPDAGAPDSGVADAGDAGDAGAADDAGGADAGVAIDPTLIWFVRSPVGTSDRVEGADAAATPGATIEVYRDADAGALLASGLADTSGAFGVAFAEKGLASVAVAARTPSATTAREFVTQRRLIANFAGKDAGDTSANPHIARRFVRSAYLDPLSGYVGDGGSGNEIPTSEYTRLLANDALSSAVDAGLLASAHTATKLFIDARESVVGVYRKSSGGRVYVFGGNLGSDIWQWDGTNWSLVPTTGTPPTPRNWMAVSYDNRNERLYVHGGYTPLSKSNPYSLDDLWAANFDASVVVWNNRTPDAGAGVGRPTARYNHAMAYDEFNNNLVLFGGAGDNATWVFSGTSGTWKKYDAGASTPRKRAEHMMTFYGSSTNSGSRVLVYGGQDGTTDLSDLYAWMGDGGTWTAVTQSTTVDGGRSSGMFARKESDVNGSPLFLYGGINKDSAFPLDVHELSFTPPATASWTKRLTTGITAARMNAAWATDKLGKIVLFGGWQVTTTAGRVGDTWLYDPSTFAFAAPSAPTTTNLPPVLSSPAFGYDSVAGRMVAMGGESIGGAYSADTWAYGSNAWSKVVDSDAPPAARFGAAVVGDPAASGYPVMFGGQTGYAQVSSETFRLAGSNWSLSLSSSPPYPTARYGAAMMADPDRGRVVLFGGCSVARGTGPPLGDTWEWNGSAWTQLSPAIAPSARTGATLIYDEVRRQGVLFGGTTNATCWGGSESGETWEFDGTTGAWTLVAAESLDGGRGGHAATFDARRGRVVIHGGWIDGGQMSDVMEYDGLAWTKLDVPNLLPRDSHGMAFDPSSGTSYVFGGNLNGGSSNDLWRIQLEQEFAQQLFQFDLADASVTPPYRALKVKLLASGAGARGTPTSAVPQSTAGAVLWVWNAFWGRWDLLSDAIADGGYEATVATNDAGALVSSGSVYLLVGSKYPSATTVPATVSTDYIELTVDY